MLARLFGAALVALCLASCSTLPAFLSPTSLAGVEQRYAAAKQIAAIYVALPTCAPGKHFSLSAPCSSAPAVAQIVKFEAVADKAIADLQAFVSANPTLDASSYTQAAILAIGNVENILATYKGQSS